MKALATALLLIAACTTPAAPLKAGAPGPGPTSVTWSAFPTLALGNSVCLALDGGAGSYASDPVVMGGYVGISESAAFFSCQPAVIGSPSGSFITQISADGILFVTPAGGTAALIDGGIGDGGTPGTATIAQTPAAFSRVLLTTLAPQVYDAGSVYEPVPLCCTVNSVPH